MRLPRHPRFSLLTALVLLLAAILASPSALAQDPLDATKPESDTPKAIAVTDIQSRADEDERFAKQVIQRAETSAPSASLSSSLDAIAEAANDKSTKFPLQTLQTLPIIRLEAIERHWRFDARRYSLWEETLRDVSTPYAKAAAELSKRRADWEATRAATAEGGIASALIDQINNVISSLEAAEQALSPPLNRQISLGRRGNAVEAEIEAGQQDVAAAIDRIDSRIMRRDAPALWHAKPDAVTSGGALVAVRNGLESETRFLKEYNSTDLYNQRLVNILQILLLPLLVWLSFRSRHKPETTAGINDEASLRVLRRPISSWLLLSMMGVLLLEPDAPLVMHQMVILLALVPVMRLLPPQAYQLLGRWPYVATGLYLLERLSFVFIANNFLYRWYSFLLTLLALALTLWLFWRARHRDATEFPGQAGKAIRAAIWLGIVALGISAMANLLGFVSLSDVLTSGIIDSGYMGLVLYVGVIVFTALIQLLIRQRQHLHFRLNKDHATPLLELINKMARLTALVGGVIFVLNRFRIFRPIRAWVESVFTHEFNFGAISITLGSVALFAIGVLIAFWTARTVRYLLEEEVTPRMSLPRGVGNSIASLSYYALLLLGLLFALSAAGFQVSQLALVFGALGVGIGLGLQDVVKNFVSGLILMFERPIQPGDTVDLAGVSGTVRDIGMRATIIKTFDGADVVVPNGTLLSENLTNWTLRDMNRRIEIEVGVSYEANPNQVVELLKSVLTTHDKLLKYPEPMVLFVGFGASSLDFTVRAWTSDFNNWVTIRSDLMTAIHAALSEAGIEIPYPQQDLHLRSVSEEAGRRLAPPLPARTDGDHAS